MRGFPSIFHARFHRKNERNPVHSFHGLVHSFLRRCWFISQDWRLFRKIFAFFASYSVIIFDGLALGWYPLGIKNSLLWLFYYTIGGLFCHCPFFYEPVRSFSSPSAFLLRFESVQLVTAVGAERLICRHGHAAGCAEYGICRIRFSFRIFFFCL